MIIAFYGLQGSSKTLSLVRRVYDKYLEGLTIYSNMDFNFPYTPITMNDLLDYTKKDDLFKDCVVVIDEMHIWADSRRSMSRNSILISIFLTQSRKRNVYIYITSQNRSQTDKRLKQNTDVEIDCSKILFDDGTLIAVNDLSLQDGRRFREWFIGNEYFNLYDTTQTISLPYDEEDLERAIEGKKPKKKKKY